MKSVCVLEAVGMVLGHEVTQVIPGKYKGPAFKKGHVIQEQDIPLLLDMGKEHVYVLEQVVDSIHENDAAEMLGKCIADNNNIYASSPSEGKVNLTAAKLGFLKVDKQNLAMVNSISGIAFSTLHTDTLVKAGEMVASVKIIPLFIPNDSLELALAHCRDGNIVRVEALRSFLVGLVITGNEVYYGRIEDKFEGVIKTKLAVLGSKLTKTIIVPDDPDQIAAAIEHLLQDNDMVFITGGMSVDPDDVTPVAIRQTQAKIVVYGTPVLPGAMFLVAYKDKKPILGLPACVMFNKITVLDIVLSKVLAGEEITKEYITTLGHGGLCRNCQSSCRYPDCSFGKW